MTLTTVLADVMTPEELEALLPKVPLVETDGVPLESSWHRAAINLLIDSITWFFRERTDFYADGNMFVYFNEEQARNKDYRGPDFFFVWGVKRFPRRRFWAIWLEGGRYPNLLMELMSPTTAHIDRTIKKDLYEKVFRAFEYFLYDPDTRQLEGWRRVEEKYVPLIPNERGQLESKELGLWVGTWEGRIAGDEPNVWVRFFEPNGQVVLTAAETEQQRAEAEQQRAEAERQRAEAERQRAEIAEAEIARLQAQLADLQGRPAPGDGASP